MCVFACREMWDNGLKAVPVSVPGLARHCSHPGIHRLHVDSLRGVLYFTDRVITPRHITERSGERKAPQNRLSMESQEKAMNFFKICDYIMAN